jgi:hypothetical protein
MALAYNKLFGLYEETEQGAHDNAFISSLNHSIKLMHASQDAQIEANVRLKCAIESAKYAESAVVTVFKYIENPLAWNASKAETSRNYECKMWLLHHSWTVGSFAVLRDTIERLDPDPTSGAPLLETINQIHLRLKNIKLRTTTNVMTEEELKSFVGRHSDFCKTSEVATSFVNKHPNSQRRFLLIKTLANHVLPVLCGIATCSNLQEHFSCTEVFEPIAKAMQLILRNNDCEVDNKSELMEVWMVVSSLFDSSEYSKSVANKVNDSIKMCHAYSKRSYIKQVQKWYEHQFHILSVKFSAAKNQVSSKSWRSGACAAMGTLFWLFAAPCLLIDDAVHRRNTKDSSFHKYNAFIKTNWEQNTTATLLCFLGVFGASGVAAAAGAGALAIHPVAAELLCATAYGGVVGAFLAYNHQQMSIAYEEASEIGRLVTLRDLKLIEGQKKGEVNHDKHFKKMERLGAKVKKFMEEMDDNDDDDDDDENPDPSKPRVLPAIGNKFATDAASTPAAQEAYNALRVQWNDLSDRISKTCSLASLNRLERLNRRKPS